MRERGLSKVLQRRIRAFYEYYLERKSVFNVSKVLPLLTTHCLPLTPYHLPLTAYPSPLTPYYLLRSLLTTYY